MFTRLTRLAQKTIHALTVAVLVLTAIFGAVTVNPSPPVTLASTQQVHPVKVAHPKDIPPFRSSPVMFVENVGQFDSRARFAISKGAGTSTFLAADGLWINLVEAWNADEPPAPDAVAKAVGLHLSFVGANRHPQIEGFNRLDTTVSYFSGTDPAGWHSNVPVWGGVRYVDIFPGVDLEVTSENGQWTWHVVRRTGGNPPQVELRIEGAQSFRSENGRLHLTTVLGELALPSPDAPGLSIVPKLAKPAARPAQTITDPDLIYSTYLGGYPANDGGKEIYVNAAGEAYVFGNAGTSFPTTSGAYDTTYSGNQALPQVWCCESD